MISKLAYIDPKAKIGKNVTIEPFATIYGNVEIGDDTWIGPNSTIMDGARIGKNCRIFPGAVISAIPQDLKFEGEKTTAEIGNNTTIREAVTINRGTKAKNKTVVGNNCLLMAYVHIAHDCIVENNAIIVNSVQVAGEVEIGESAIIGGSSAIHQFVKIGKHAMISGGSLIRQDVPPFVTAAHEPVSFVGVNSTGLKRRNFDNKQIEAIQDAYRFIFQEKLNRTNALNKIKEELELTDDIKSIVNFIENSKRGIIKGAKERKQNNL
ncbi:MAG: acyl-ACP--UDP-N-acetylglucosamine O-acyltransferase [Bacteroidota bacterium]|nr:acyl-ACP--UDP-N-acetylglucosamine O-acyltransferase [Bacteroidota bacterium]